MWFDGGMTTNHTTPSQSMLDAFAEAHAAGRHGSGLVPSSRRLWAEEGCPACQHQIDETTATEVPCAPLQAFQSDEFEVAWEAFSEHADSEPLTEVFDAFQAGWNARTDDILEGPRGSLAHADALLLSACYRFIRAAERADGLDTATRTAAARLQVQATEGQCQATLDDALITLGRLAKHKIEANVECEAQRSALLAAVVDPRF